MTDARVIADRYTLGPQRARETTATSWDARDLVFGHDVVVRQVHLAGDLSGAERADAAAAVFAHAAAVLSLDHPRIVKVLDVVAADGEPWVVTGPPPAPSLREVVAASGPLPVDAVVDLAGGLLEALAAAHAGGVWHLDVNPSSVLLDAEGRPLLTDFLAATPAGAGRDAAAAGRLPPGTPGYVAPERAISGEVGPRTDLFGLGAVLFYAVEGHGPFDAEDVIAAVFAAAIHPHPRPARAGVLTGFIDALLEKDPTHRPGIGEALALLGAVTGQPVPEIAFAPQPPAEPDAAATAEPELITAEHVGAMFGLGLVSEPIPVAELHLSLGSGAARVDPVSPAAAPPAVAPPVRLRPVEPPPGETARRSPPAVPAASDGPALGETVRRPHPPVPPQAPPRPAAAGPSAPPTRQHPPPASAQPPAPAWSAAAGPPAPPTREYPPPPRYPPLPASGWPPGAGPTAPPTSDDLPRGAPPPWQGPGGHPRRPEPPAYLPPQAGPRAPQHAAGQLERAEATVRRPSDRETAEQQVAAWPAPWPEIPPAPERTGRGMSRRVLLGAGALGAVAAVGAGWVAYTKVRHSPTAGPRPTGTASPAHPTTAPPAPAAGTRAWTAQVPAGVKVRPFVAPGDLVILEGSTTEDTGDTNVGVRLADGTVAWTSALKLRCLTPGTDGSLYALTDQAGAYSLARVDPATGSVSHSAPITDAVRTMTVDGGTAYLVGAAKPLKGSGQVVQAVDVASGHAAWTFTATFNLGAAPQLDAAHVYVGTKDAVYALDRRTGAVKWHVPIGGSPAVRAVTAGALYVHAATGLFVLDPATGRQLWTLVPPDAPYLNSPAGIAGDLVYTGARGGTGHPPQVRCVRAADGTAVWQKLLTTGAARPVVHGGGVYASGEDAALICVAASDGHPVWHYDLGDTCAIEPVVAGGLVLVPTASGTLHAVHTGAA